MSPGSWLEGKGAEGVRPGNEDGASPLALTGSSSGLPTSDFRFLLAAWAVEGSVGRSLITQI